MLTDQVVWSVGDDPTLYRTFHHVLLPNTLVQLAESGMSIVMKRSLYLLVLCRPE